MKTSSRSIRPAVVATGIVFGALLGGCSNDKDPTSFGAISGDLAPDLVGLSQRQADRDGAFAVTNVTQTLSSGDDLSRAMYWDHPSRLSPYPVIHTNRSPR